MKQFDLFIENIQKSNNNATNRFILSYLFFPGLHESKHYNLQKLPKKSASRRIIVLIIVTTLMKVRRKGLSFAWLPLTFRCQNTSAQSLILLNFFYLQELADSVTEFVFNILCLNLAHILQTCYPFAAADSHIT